VIVHDAVPAPGRRIGTTLNVGTALDGLPSSVGFTPRATVASGSCHLDLRGAYPSGQGAHSYEGVTRTVAAGTGDAVTAGGSTIVVARATRMIPLTEPARYAASTGWEPATRRPVSGRVHNECRGRGCCRSSTGVEEPRSARW